jgi:hypothetical protein
MRLQYFIKILLAGCLLFASCKKYLDVQADGALQIPTTIADLQAMLDNVDVMNGMSSGQRGIVPALGEAAGNDYFVTGFPKTTANTGMKNLYTWCDDFTTKYYDWAYGYDAIRYANTVLEGAAKIQPSPSEQHSYNNVRGSALFFRGFMYFQLLQIFAPPYNSQTAKNDFGIALKFKSDVNEPIKRSRLQESYDRIITDVKEAIELLPNAPPGGIVTRPAKPAAYALLAKTYLVMHQYDSGLYYSNACLKLKNDLLNYNDTNKVQVNANFPFSQLNDEVIFHSCLVQPNISLLFSPMRHRVDSNLYQLYDLNDLRKSLYFKNQATGRSFRGSYDGSTTFFGGIAVDEVYLIRAECKVRTGYTKDAMSDLNALLEKRWKTGAFIPIIITDSANALQTILTERRKELVFRGIHWSDLRRLNSEGANIIIQRWLDGELFILPPNSPNYTFLIPTDAIGNMPQNLR